MNRRKFLAGALASAILPPIATKGVAWTCDWDTGFVGGDKLVFWVHPSMYRWLVLDESDVLSQDVRVIRSLVDVSWEQDDVELRHTWPASEAVEKARACAFVRELYR